MLSKSGVYNPWLSSIIEFVDSFDYYVDLVNLKSSKYNKVLLIV